MDDYNLYPIIYVIMINFYFQNSYYCYGQIQLHIDYLCCRLLPSSNGYYHYGLL
jgi:hypothetical protein